MAVRKVAVFVLAVSSFLCSCASSDVKEPQFALTSPIMPKHVDIKVKQQYIKDTRHVLTLFHKVTLDTKIYHPQFNFQELSIEIDKYINTFVEPMLTDSDLYSSVETKVELAKLYLVIIALYLDIGDKWQAREYLESFHNRYEKDKHLYDMSVNSMDIGYFTLGEGIRELEKRLFRTKSSSVGPRN